MKRTVAFSLACAAGLLFGLALHAQDATPTPAASCPSCSGSGPTCAAPAASCPVCTATGAACPNSAAGPRKHGEHGDVLKRLSAALSLSGTQEAAIAPILQGAAPQMKAIADEAMAKRKALIESVSSQITPILTPDQQTKFSAIVQKIESGRGLAMRRRFGHHSWNGSPSASADASTSASHSGPGGPGPDVVLQHLTQALDLTSDQQSQIKPILEAAHTQMQSIRQDSSLTQEQKLAKVRETMDGAHSQMNALLTPEQQQKVGAMKNNFHHRHAPGAQPSASPSATPTPAPSA